MKLETDLARIKILAKAREDENWEFRSFLKGCDTPQRKIDAIVHDLYQRVSAEIDCTQCGNCCREMQPVLNQEDIRVFADGLGVPVDQFAAQYLVPAENAGEFCFNKLPCPFLEGNLCTNYENRPEDCRSFPHLHKGHFTSRLMGVVENCAICPIVFNVYEHLKDQLWHGRR